MRLIERKPCGCRVYASCGLPVEKLCDHHLNEVVKEAEETERKRAQLKVSQYIKGGLEMKTKEVLKLEMRVPLEILWKDEKDYMDKLTQEVKKSGII